MIFSRVPLLRPSLVVLMAVLGTLHATGAAAEDGYQLWLRYAPVDASAHDSYAARATGIVAFGRSPVIAAASAELRTGLAGMLGAAPVTSNAVADGSIVLGTPDSSP